MIGSLLLLAVGLAMDATAAAATRGFSAARIRPRDVALVAAYFGGFQALMPLLGALVGESARPFIQPVDHWVAFVILGLLGAKMVVGGLREGEDDERVADPFGHRALFPIAVATSIDALAAGFTLPTFDLPLALSIATIGLVTAALSALGLGLGRRFGAQLGGRLDVFGGLALSGLGVFILIKHLQSGI